MGDDAAALLAGLHEVDQVNSFANFEAAGSKFALLSFVHVDVDGRGEKILVVTERKRTLDPKVFVSKWHCGSHVTGLCDSCMFSAVDEQLIGPLHNCRTFLQPSGHFFRLVQATAEGVSRYRDTPIGNMSPNSEAEDLRRQEIRDHSISNWNAFDEATMRTDAWSSDEEHYPLPHRQGGGGRGGENASKAKAVGSHFLEFFSTASLATTESHRPSRAQQSIMLSRS